MKKIIDYFVDNSIVVGILSVLIIVLGVFSAFSLNFESRPIINNRRRVHTPDLFNFLSDSCRNRNNFVRHRQNGHQNNNTILKNTVLLNYTANLLILDFKEVPTI